RARSDLVLPRSGHPTPHAIMGRHDPGGARVPRLRLVDLHLAGGGFDADLPGREPSGRLASGRSGPDVEGGVAAHRGLSASLNDASRGARLATVDNVQVLQQRLEFEQKLVPLVERLQAARTL